MAIASSIEEDEGGMIKGTSDNSFASKYRRPHKSVINGRSEIPFSFEENLEQIRRGKEIKVKGDIRYKLGILFILFKRTSQVKVTSARNMHSPQFPSTIMRRCAK